MSFFTIDQENAAKYTIDIVQFIEDNKRFTKTKIPEMGYILAATTALILAKQMKNKSRNDQDEILRMYKQVFAEKYYKLLADFKGKEQIFFKKPE